MKISTKGIYALEAVVDMALHKDGGLVTIREISGRTGISEKYLERIVGALKKKGILESTRGKFGGYMLARDEAELTVGEILMAVEGDLAPVECLKSSSDCKIDCERCATRGLWNGLWQQIRGVVEQVTVKALVDGIYEQRCSHHEPEFYI